MVKLHYQVISEQIAQEVQVCVSKHLSYMEERLLYVFTQTRGFTIWITH